MLHGKEIKLLNGFLKAVFFFQVLSKGIELSIRFSNGLLTGMY